MARDAKLTVKWDNIITSTIKAMPNAVQTIMGASNVNANSYSAFVNFGGYLATQADAAAFGAQADTYVPGTSSVPLLHSGGRDQLYLRVAYSVAQAYVSTSALQFVVEGTQDATAASPVVYTLGQTIATGAVSPATYTSTAGSVVGSTVIQVAAATGLSATFSTTVPTITLATPLTVALPIGSVVTVTGTPGNFAAATNFYVVSSTLSTVQLAATPGGTPIQASSTGTTPTIVLQSHNFAVGDIVQLGGSGAITFNGQTPIFGSCYQVLSVPAYNQFTIGLGPGSTYNGVAASATALTVAGTVTSATFTKTVGGRIASVPIAPNFAGSIRLNIKGSGAGNGLVIVNSASIVYGRDSAAIG